MEVLNGPMNREEDYLEIVRLTCVVLQRVAVCAVRFYFCRRQKVREGGVVEVGGPAHCLGRSFAQTVSPRTFTRRA